MSTVAKKPLIAHGTQACYINCQNLNSRPDWFSWLALSFQNENSELRAKAKCQCQEKCKQGCHKVRSFPPPCIIFMLMMPPKPQEFI
jgi:Cdc6-like AAA superfamily ATPase